jgi:hypothetical protein
MAAQQTAAKPVHRKAASSQWKIQADPVKGWGSIA